VSHIELGVMSSPRADGGNPFATVARYGVETTQFANWDPSLWREDYARRIRSFAREAGVKLAAVWAGYGGPAVWNLTEGPKTLGLVPGRYRRRRVSELKRAGEFAAWCGAPAVITHCGFIPEDPNDPVYAATVRAIRQVAGHLLERGVGFWFETGQETPVTLLRTIQDVGLPNLGINLDTANLILYGKGNPLDALDVFGPYVRNLHAKDGVYPTDGRSLGREVPIGQGKVNFPRIIARLVELGFSGQVVIEREITGPQQARDIRKALSYLRRLVRTAQRRHGAPQTSSAARGRTRRGD